MNEKVDHWFDSFENFHKNYVIMPLKSLNSSLLEESFYITVLSQPCFINRENEARFYLIATIQLLYCGVLFRKVILNNDCYTIIIRMDKKSTFFHHYQDIMILKELQRIFGDMYLGKKMLLMYYLFWKT